MEVQRETRRRSLRGAGPTGPTPVRRRSARHLVEVSEKPANVVFNPSDPYSAAMDDMPLKDLFPNMKVRKRSQGKKVETVEVPSPKSTETDESVRSKLRDSLAAALTKIDSAEWEQDRGQDLKAETEKGEQVENTAGEPKQGDQEMANDRVTPNLEGVSLEQKAGAELKDKLDTMLDDCKSVKEENVDSVEFVEAPSKRIKLEVESIKVADSSNQSEASELAERVAFDIEAELYKQFGGVNRKYKEKARSLLFNLKDRSNPELRSRVLAGEITPENLCSMNAEQLASKELSEWRMAKAEEFAHMVVLTEADTEQPRLVKKTHKGEIEVQVEKDDLLTEVVTAGSQARFMLATQQEIEETGANALPSAASADEIDNGNDTDVVEPDEESLEFSPIRELNLTVGISAATDQAPDIMMQEGGEGLEGASHEEENAGLPAILSLDEFVGSKKVKEPKVSVKGDELDLKLGLNEVKPLANLSQIDSMISSSPTSVKDKVPRKSVASPNRKHTDLGNSKNGAISQKERKKEHRLNEKLWEGIFQLSGSQISPVLALFKSGDGVELQSWPKLIEIKGRVRLDALEKFLQELRLARSRAVMIITCRVGEGGLERGASVNAMKEAANQYQRGERVGYAEPVPSYELYLFPGAGSSLKLLVEHGYLSNDQISAEEEGTLIGFVVCRRSTGPSNVSHKSSSHYYNANRHAISAQLDSPTRPNEIQWTGNVVATSKTPASKELENYSSQLSFINLQGGGSVPNSSAEGLLTTANKSKSNSLLQIGQNSTEPDSLFPQAPQDLRSGKVKPDWLRKELVKDEEADDDLPPGFGPKAMTMPKRSILDDDDDDLPEYDFSSQNSAPIFTSVKVPDIGPRAPFNMQAYPQGLLFPAMSQAPQGSAGGLSSQLETAIPFEQLNSSGQHASQFPRPIASHVGGPSEQVRSLMPSSAQASQPLHFQAAGPRPPPGPPPGPPPFGIFPPRPHTTVDGSFAMRMPGSVQMPALNVLHAEQKEAFAGSYGQLPQNRPGTPQAYDDQRTRATIPLLQSHPAAPASQTPAGPGERRGGSQGSSLWDDDDMPEWCPPALSQQSENRQIPSRPPVMQNVEPGSASVAPRGMAPPVMGGGWQGMPLPPAVPLQGEGRGILQAPPPAMRYPGPPSGGHFPIARPEKFSTERGPNIRPNETRGFKGGK